MKSSARIRQRNPRGEGGRLRQEITQAAIRLTDAQGAEAVTLRAVAREAGISAPSIYSHFKDRDEILDAVIQDCFAQLASQIAAARDAHHDPVQRLQAGCQAYLRYAGQQPHRYALLFRRIDTPDATAYGMPGDTAAAAFQTLVAGIAECAAAGCSTSTEPFNDATALWSALHGYATLTATQTGFPWPARENTIARIIHGLARLKSA